MLRIFNHRIRIAPESLVFFKMNFVNIMVDITHVERLHRNCVGLLKT